MSLDLASAAETELLTTRERLIEAAKVCTVQVGWAGVTMEKVARQAGLSRRTVYNEVGTKQDLAQAVVLGEVERLMTLVLAACARHPHDTPSALREAVQGVLGFVASHPIVRAILDTAAGTESDLLPLLTTQSSGVLDLFTETVLGQIEDRGLGVPLPRLRSFVDSLVRLTMSHVLTPTEQTPLLPDTIAHLASAVFAPGR